MRFRRVWAARARGSPGSTRAWPPTSCVWQRPLREACRWELAWRGPRSPRASLWGTLGRGPVQSAAALAALDVIESEGLVYRALVAGRRLMSALADLWPGAEVRGRGLLIAVEFSTDVANEIVERALGAGLILNATGPETLRLAPPLVISNDELERGLAILEEVSDAILTTT